MAKRGGKRRFRKVLPEERISHDEFGALLRGAHQRFDALWASGLVGRRRLYFYLASHFNIHMCCCHMSIMGPHYLREVPCTVDLIEFEVRERLSR